MNPLNLPKPPRDFGTKPDRNTPKIPLLTPGQKRILAYPVIQDMISRFGLQPQYSSLDALDSIKINHAVESLFATLAGSTPPPTLDLAPYLPLSPDDQRRAADRQLQKKLSTLPPGLTIDQKGNTTFDTQWRDKGIHPTQLPPDHPGYCPF